MLTFIADAAVVVVGVVGGGVVVDVVVMLLCRCGGCGSKVGSTLLSRVLRQIQASIKKNKSVISGVGGGRFL